MKYPFLATISIFLILSYCYLAPYSKVEESFNLQATHDILNYKFELYKYDHKVFEGVVPRTFIGSLATAFVASFFKDVVPKDNHLLLVRMILGIFIGYSQIRLANLFSNSTSKFYLLFFIVQFHLPFWLSRTIPNSYALFTTSLGYYNLLKRKEPTLNSWLNFLAFMVPSFLIFRSEILILTTVTMLVEFGLNLKLVTRNYNSLKILTYLILCSVASIALTVAVDSWFWSGTSYTKNTRFLWPEFYSFYFNAIQGQSVLWGTSPFHSYFTLYLPKVLGVAYLLNGLSLVILINSLFTRSETKISNETKALMTRTLIPPLVYCIAMSRVPHKEWRFLMYVIPLFNINAAVTLNHILKRLSPYAKILLRYTVYLLMMLQFALTLLQVLASSLNYPGGEALSILHKKYGNQKGNETVHICNLAATTGVNRFSYLPQGLVYDKTENLTKPEQFLKFDYLITDQPDLHAQHFSISADIYGFSWIKLKKKSGILGLIKAKKPKFSSEDLKKAWIQKFGYTPNSIKEDFLDNCYYARSFLVFLINDFSIIDIICEPKLFIMKKDIVESR